MYCLWVCLAELRAEVQGGVCVCMYLCMFLIYSICCFLCILHCSIAFCPRQISPKGDKDNLTLSYKCCEKTWPIVLFGKVCLPASFQIFLVITCQYLIIVNVCDSRNIYCRISNTGHMSELCVFLLTCFLHLLHHSWTLVAMYYVVMYSM